MAAAVATLLLLGAFLLALAPLLRPVQAQPVRSARRDELLDERERLVAAIKDSDLDLAMGKVSPEDHAEVRRSLEREAVGVMAALERDGGPTSRSPEQLDAP